MIHVLHISTLQKVKKSLESILCPFSNLPAIETITVNIYKEADKKKKKDKNQLLGYVHIPVEEIMGQQMTEKWYTASSATVGKAGKETKTEQPIIRLKARYQTVQILPMDIYQDFINVSFEIIIL